MKKILSITISSILLLFISNTLLAETTVKFMRFFGDCNAEVKGSALPEKFNSECGVITSLVNKFNQENQGKIHVKTTSVDWDSYYNKLKTSIAGGNVPDIAVMHASRMPTFINKHLLTELTPDFKPSGIDIANFSEAAQKGFNYQGKYYALPWDIHGLLTCYNVDIFKKAGLVDTDGNPIIAKNVADMKAQAKKIKEVAPDVIYMNGIYTGGESQTVMLIALTHQQGKDFITADKLNIKDEQYVKALQVQKDLIKLGYLAVNDRGTNFLNGKVAMHIDGTWVLGDTLNQVKSDRYVTKNIYFGLFPQFFDKQQTMWVDSHSWVMPTNKNRTAEVKQASLTFLKFLYDNNVYWTRTGHLSIRKDANNDQRFLSLPQRKNIKDMAKLGTPPPHILNYNKIARTIAAQADTILLNDKAIEDGLNKVYSRVKRFKRK